MPQGSISSREDAVGVAGINYQVPILETREQVMKNCGSIPAECGSGPDESTYATLSLTTNRDARRNWTSENHLYNMVHRGYASEPGGHARCPFDFYPSWVNNPEGAKEQVESLTRGMKTALEKDNTDNQARPRRFGTWKVPDADL